MTRFCRRPVGCVSVWTGGAGGTASWLAVLPLRSCSNLCSSAKAIQFFAFSGNCEYNSILDATLTSVHGASSQQSVGLGSSWPVAAGDNFIETCAFLMVEMNTLRDVLAHHPLRARLTKQSCLHKKTLRTCERSFLSKHTEHQTRKSSKTCFRTLIYAPVTRTCVFEACSIHALMGCARSLVRGRRVWSPALRPSIPPRDPRILPVQETSLSLPSVNTCVP